MNTRQAKKILRRYWPWMSVRWGTYCRAEAKADSVNARWRTRHPLTDEQRQEIDEKVKLFMDLFRLKNEPQESLAS